MGAGRSRDLTVALVGASVVMLAVAVAVTAPAPAVGGGASSFSAAPDGTKAALLLLQQLGYRVDRSFEPATVVGSDPRHTLLLLVDPDEHASELDRRSVREFVAAGGTLLATGCGGATFLTSSAPQKDETVAKSRVRARESGPLTAGAPEISMAKECGEPHLGNGYRALYGDEDGAVRVSRIGDGVVQWWEGSTPLTNDAIDDAGNLEFVLNAIGGRERRILWDEYYHGQRRSLLSYAASTPLAWAGLQLLILALAAAMTFTRRRAPIRPRWTPGRHAPMEFVETMATLYEEAGALSAALQTSGARTRRLIREATGLPAGTPDDRLAAALALRRSQDPAEIESLLTASGASVTRRDWSEASVLAIVRRLQQLSLTLSGAGGGVRRAQEDVRTVA